MSLYIQTVLPNSFPLTGVIPLSDGRLLMCTEKNGVFVWQLENGRRDRINFDSILPRLSKDIETPLGKEFGGTALSGGEWQRLAMSRAFCREEATLLILDEPTSALDPQSECEVFEKFAEATHEKTTLFITHRLGSAKMADRILVFHDGALVEEGTHANLLQRGSEYSRLYFMQASQYNHSDKLWEAKDLAKVVLENAGKE